MVPSRGTSRSASILPTETQVNHGNDSRRQSRRSRDRTSLSSTRSSRSVPDSYTDSGLNPSTTSSAQGRDESDETASSSEGSIILINPTSQAPRWEFTVTVPATRNTPAQSGENELTERSRASNLRRRPPMALRRRRNNVPSSQRKSVSRMEENMFIAPYPDSSVSSQSRTSRSPVASISIPPGDTGSSPLYRMTMPQLQGTRIRNSVQESIPESRLDRPSNSPDIDRTTSLEVASPVFGISPQNRGSAKRRMTEQDARSPILSTPPQSEGFPLLGNTLTSSAYTPSLSREDHSNSPRSTTSTAWSSQNSLEFRLMNNYITRVAPLFDSFEKEKYFATEIPQRSTRNALLKNALLAVSTRQLNYVQGKPDAESSQYVKECHRNISKMLQTPSGDFDENSLAAVVLLRTREDLCDDEERSYKLEAKYILASTTAFAARGGFAEAISWAALIQHMYRSLKMHVSLPVEIDLRHYSTSRALKSSDDESCTKAIILLCARVIDAAFREGHMRLSLANWAKLEANVETWYRERRPNSTPSPWPELHILNSAQAVGLQHYHLAKMTLAAFKPQSSQSISSPLGSVSDIEMDVIQSLRNVMGVAASSNSISMGAWSAFQILQTGVYPAGSLAVLSLGTREEQDAVSSFLEKVNRFLGCETGNFRHLLHQEWARRQIRSNHRRRHLPSQQDLQPQQAPPLQNQPPPSQNVVLRHQSQDSLPQLRNGTYPQRSQDALSEHHDVLSQQTQHDLPDLQDDTRPLRTQEVFAEPQDGVAPQQTLAALGELRRGSFPDAELHPLPETPTHVLAEPQHDVPGPQDGALPGSHDILTEQENTGLDQMDVILGQQGVLSLEPLDVFSEDEDAPEHQYTPNHRDALAQQDEVLPEQQDVLEALPRSQEVASPAQNAIPQLQDVLLEQQDVLSELQPILDPMEDVVAHQSQTLSLQQHVPDLTQDAIPEQLDFVPEQHHLAIPEDTMPPQPQDESTIIPSIPKLQEHQSGHQHPAPNQPAKPSSVDQHHEPVEQEEASPGRQPHAPAQQVEASLEHQNHEPAQPEDGFPEQPFLPFEQRASVARQEPKTPRTPEAQCPTAHEYLPAHPDEHGSGRNPPQEQQQLLVPQRVPEQQQIPAPRKAPRQPRVPKPRGGTGRKRVPDPSPAEKQPVLGMQDAVFLQENVISEEHFHPAPRQAAPSPPENPHLRLQHIPPRSPPQPPPQSAPEPGQPDRLPEGPPPSFSGPPLQYQPPVVYSQAPQQYSPTHQGQNSDPPQGHRYIPQHHHHSPPGYHSYHTAEYFLPPAQHQPSSVLNTSHHRRQQTYPPVQYPAHSTQTTYTQPQAALNIPQENQLRLQIPHPRIPQQVLQRAQQQNLPNYGAQLPQAAMPNASEQQPGYTNTTPLFQSPQFVVDGALHTSQQQGAPQTNPWQPRATEAARSLSRDPKTPSQPRSFAHTESQPVHAPPSQPAAALKRTCPFPSLAQTFPNLRERLPLSKNFSLPHVYWSSRSGDNS